MKQFELPCYDSRKSFYGKAIVLEKGDTSTLFSYGTAVAAIRGNEFMRLWGGYSATTMRHVNSFLEHYGYHVGGKRFWDMCPVGTPVPVE